MASARVFQEDLVRSKSRMFCDRNEKTMMENARAVRQSVDAQEEAREKKSGNRALNSPVNHHRTSMLTSENKLRKAATSALTFMTFS